MTAVLADHDHLLRRVKLMENSSEPSMLQVPVPEPTIWPSSISRWISTAFLCMVALLLATGLTASQSAAALAMSTTQISSAKS